MMVVLNDARRRFKSFIPKEAVAAQQTAINAEKWAEYLAAKLRELGIDPDN